MEEDDDAQYAGEDEGDREHEQEEAELEKRYVFSYPFNPISYRTTPGLRYTTELIICSAGEEREAK